jgi:hypothetical protein
MSVALVMMAAHHPHSVWNDARHRGGAFGRRTAWNMRRLA